MSDGSYQMAIVGFGPRGLYALECLCVALRSEKHEPPLMITIYEPCSYLGAGPVWNPEQSGANRANVSLRMLENLEAREATSIQGVLIPAFESFSEWYALQDLPLVDEDIDIYPMRSTIGRYLYERALSIVGILQGAGILSLIRKEVDQLKWVNDRFEVWAEHQYISDYDEVALTIGHQETVRDDQISSWKEHVKVHRELLLYEDTYPVERMTNDNRINNQSSVGIRGLGLAMIDVTRALCSERGGRFELTDRVTQCMEFHRSDAVPKRIIAFSLDGRPMAPKPINASIDKLFAPTEGEKDSFRKSLMLGASSEHEGISFFINAMVEVAYNICARNSMHDSAEDLKDTLKAWIEDDKLIAAPIQETQGGTIENMRAYAQMATGTSLPSLDYLLGQVWRQCQPIIYKTLSHPDFSDRILAEIIKVDERFKRYSYGPPLESVQQMLALVEAGVLDLRFSNDPDIEMDEGGWKMKSKSNQEIVDVMIDAVLDSPQVSKVSSPLITSLLANDLIKPVHNELGIDTKSDGLVCSEKIEAEIPLAVLGRLAKGSVLGVDAILECFGPRIRDWAHGLVARVEKHQAAVPSSSSKS